MWLNLATHLHLNIIVSTATHFYSNIHYFFIFYSCPIRLIKAWTISILSFILLPTQTWCLLTKHKPFDWTIQQKEQKEALLKFCLFPFPKYQLPNELNNFTRTWLHFTTEKSFLRLSLHPGFSLFLQTMNWRVQKLYAENIFSKEHNHFLSQAGQAWEDRGKPRCWLNHSILFNHI